MLASSSILIALVLAGSPSVQDVRFSSWGTPYIQDDQKVIQAETELKRCAQRLLATNKRERDELRNEVSDCFSANFDQITTAGHEVYYFMKGQAEDGSSRFADFSVCFHHLSSPMWDFPEEYTTQQFRDDIQECIDLFPR